MTTTSGTKLADQFVDESTMIRFKSRQTALLLTFLLLVTVFLILILFDYDSIFYKSSISDNIHRSQQSMQSSALIHQLLSLAKDDLDSSLSYKNTVKINVTSDSVSHRSLILNKKLPHKRIGVLPSRYNQKGFTFNDTGIGEEVKKDVIISIIYSFSPWIDGKLRKMYYDAAGENEIYATGPAMVWRKNELLVVQRIWLAQYERDNAYDKVGTYYNTWKENMAYEYRFDIKYRKKSGHLLTIPTPINCQYSYRADGVYDPRLTMYKNHTYMTFHLWSHDYEEKQINGRMFLWDYDKQEIYKLKMTKTDDLKRLHRAEINWIPWEVNNTLYFLYSMDPLRIIKCEEKEFHCHFQYLPRGEENYEFDYLADRLRGGSPVLHYKKSYYITIAHSQLVSLANLSYYASHLVVLSSVPNFRIVYVSAPLKVHDKMLNSAKVVRSHTIAESFIYPVSSVIWNPNVIDIGVHLNDNRGFILRMHGLEEIMNEIIDIDERAKVHMGPVLRSVQKTVGNLTGEHFHIKYK